MVGGFFVVFRLFAGRFVDGLLMVLGRLVVVVVPRCGGLFVGKVVIGFC